MKNRSMATGALMGLAGGIAGVLAMRFAMKTAHRVLQAQSADSNTETFRFTEDRRRRGESASNAVGRILYTRVTKREPTEREKAKLGQAVHWTYGIAMAVGYGMLRGKNRHASDVIGGAIFGAGLWGLGDELLLPALGLGPKPTAVSIKSHVEALAAHLGYGVVTAATVQGLGRVLDALEDRRHGGERRILAPKKSNHVRQSLPERLASR